jgi:OTU domain-containing protein 6
LLAKHRAERKILQNKVQTLKKSVMKGDKKKKKEIDTQIAILESEFEEKCSIELKNFQDKKLNNTGEEAIEVKTQSNEEEGFKNTENKASKSKKRKDKKEEKSQKREVEIALQEIENKNLPAAIELKKIKEKLSKRGLQIKDVNADGNCMYYAICDQLFKIVNLKKNCEDLRILTCDYMRKNQADFQPYLSSEDDGETFNDEKYEEYCENIKRTLVWGGQLELRALSDILKIKIIVIQADSNDIVIGENHNEEMLITYHRLLYGSGEHYNSTEPLVLNDDD